MRTLVNGRRKRSAALLSRLITRCRTPGCVRVTPGFGSQTAIIACRDLPLRQGLIITQPLSAAAQRPVPVRRAGHLS